MLTLAASSARLAEGGGAVTLTARLDVPAPPGGTRVTLAASGESTATDDYALSATTITIAAGATAGTATLTAAADDIEDPGETIMLVARSVNPALTSRPLTLVIAHAPGAPSGLRLSPGDRSLAVSWAVPVSDGDSAITSYDVQYRDATRSEAANDDGVEHGLMLRSLIRW